MVLLPFTVVKKVKFNPEYITKNKEEYLKNQLQIEIKNFLKPAIFEAKLSGNYFRLKEEAKTLLINYNNVARIYYMIKF